ncbi:MAG: ABC transporter substrate-binding protein [Sporolactobacillus sp.]|nr:ABC transporter substrate-binding protein [Sporolactobacillus sp.]
MNRLCKLLATTVAVAGMLITAACGNTSGSSQSGSSSNSGSKTVTLGVWKGTDAEVTARKKLIANFEKDTGLKVKERIYNDYVTQLQTDLIGGKAPDVFYVDSSVLPSLEEKHVLEPLDSYISKTKGFNKSDFYGPVYNAFKGQDGKQYGVPKDYSTLALIYNKDMFKKAGISPSEIPTKDSEMETFLEKLKAKLPKNVAPDSFTADLARQMFIAEASGEKLTTDKGYSNLNNPKIIKAIQPLVNMYQKGLLKRPTDLGQDNSENAFGVKKAALTMDGNWIIAQLQQNFKDVHYGVKPLPTINGKKTTMVYTVSYSMNANSKNKANAWKLLNYFTGKKGMEIWAKNASVLPSRKSIADKMNIANDPIFKPFVEGANYAMPFQEGSHLTTIQNEYNNMIPSVLKGDMTLKAAMKKATKSANNQIDQGK